MLTIGGTRSPAFWTIDYFYRRLNVGLLAGCHVLSFAADRVQIFRGESEADLERVPLRRYR